MGLVSLANLSHISSVGASRVTASSIDTPLISSV